MSSYSRSQIMDRYRQDNSRSSRDSSRRRSPSPPTKPRDENELPAEFGRLPEPAAKEDENTVLKRMKTAFTHSPLNEFNECILQNKKIKIWTRNFEEVRGVCTGYVVAFDKHWNIILSDIDEVYLKPKKAKTPYLLKIEAEDLPELTPKVRKPKKPKAPEEEAAEKPVDNGKAKKPKNKKKRREYCQRHVKQMMIRGDNIVMCAVIH